ncbi:MAG: hypothetical protein M3Z21_00680 [Pseudomonadota bacterium]|nr:hypothetical protein [Pseudomonadota bacterium]
MQHDIILCTAHGGHDHGARDYLRQEIAFYEARLKDLDGPGQGNDGQALRRTYQALLRERRRQLAGLQ